jgi:hypothetical protein
VERRGKGGEKEKRRRKKVGEKREKRGGKKGKKRRKRGERKWEKRKKMRRKGKKGEKRGEKRDTQYNKNHMSTYSAVVHEKIIVEGRKEEKEREREWKGGKIKKRSNRV